MADPDDGGLAPTRLRFDALDVVRGIAVLGILLMNIEEMGTPKAAWAYPPLISWTGADQTVWWLRDVLAKGTMRGLLSLLFGAGFILMTTRAGRDDGKVADAYHRRNIWLVLFGLVHGYLILWPGDILLIYGAVGLFLFPWRHWPPQRLLKAGLVVVIAMTLLSASQSEPRAVVAAGGRRARAIANRRDAVHRRAGRAEGMEKRENAPASPSAGRSQRRTPVLADSDRSPLGSPEDRLMLAGAPSCGPVSGDRVGTAPTARRVRGPRPGGARCVRPAWSLRRRRLRQPRPESTTRDKLSDSGLLSAP